MGLVVGLFVRLFVVAVVAVVVVVVVARILPLRFPGPIMVKLVSLVSALTGS